MSTSILLSTRLREGTKTAHMQAESATFVRSFLKGAVDRASYSRLVANLYWVYEAMEEALDRHASHDVLRHLDFPELRRKPSLEADLDVFLGAAWRARPPAPLSATRRYVTRIRTVARERPELLVGHLYTRYLGDLSGGQILGRVAARALALEGGRGLAFYRFEQIDDPKEFKAMYRERLDALPLAVDAAEAVVEEAVGAFHHNMALFEDVGHGADAGDGGAETGSAAWTPLTAQASAAPIAPET